MAMLLRAPALFVLLAAALLIYLPGAGGPYVADDFPNLAANRALVIDSLSWAALRDASLSSPASPWYRPLSMLSFALNYSLAGNLEPRSAKLFNIVLHLCAGVLVFLLARSLLTRLRMAGFPENDQQATPAALLAGAYWLLHPLFVSTVLYTVQRMTLLSALFILGGCLFYLHRRPRVAAPADLAVLTGGVALFTGLAFLCKENGALLPGFLLLIEWSMFRFRLPSLPRPASWLLIAFLGAPVLLILGYLAGLGIQNWDREAAAYYFTTGERFLTQFRALAHYAGWLLLLNPEPMGLYHDDIPVSQGLLQPPATLAALLSWVAIAVAALLLAWRRNLLGFGLLWFLWGHSLESSTLNLGAVWEHRNYLPGFGIALALAGALQAGLVRTRSGPLLRSGVLVLLLVILPAWQLYDRVQVWADERTLTIESMLAHPDSALTLIDAAVFLDARGDPAAAAAALREARRAAPRDSSHLYAEAALHCEHRGRQVMPARLASEILARAGESPRTRMARNQYVEMVKACAPSSASDAVLAVLYTARRGDRKPEVAALSLYGLGAIHLHRGEHQAAVEAWEQAAARYPEITGLRPMLDELKRRLERGRQ